MPKIDYIPAGEHLLHAITLRDPPPDKGACALSWARHTAGLHHMAEEILLNELIY